MEYLFDQQRSSTTLQIKLPFPGIFFHKSNQNDVKQVILNDADVESKLDFSKPINFFIHGWYGGVANVDGSIPLKNDGM